MENKEAIEMLERFQNPEPWEPQITSRAYEALEMAIAALKKQEQDRWMPVTERLPEENGRYIICYEDATTFLDYFNGKWFFPLGKHAMACEETGTIVAWRPLPEPYTEEEA